MDGAPCEDAVFNLLHAAQEPHGNLTASGGQNFLRICPASGTPALQPQTTEYTQLISLLGPCRAGTTLPLLSVNYYIFNDLRA